MLGVVEFDPPLEEGPFKVTGLLRLHADQQSTERVQERSIQQKYEQILQQNPYEILGVGTAASASEISRAYEQIKSRYGRDRLLPRILEKFGSEIDVIESRLVEAFLTLSQPARSALQSAGSGPAKPQVGKFPEMVVRVELDRARSQVEADKTLRVADNYFAKAQKCVREADFHNAIQYGKLAISHNASDARYFALLADCQARNTESRWQKMAEENYGRAAQLDPWNPNYWVCLGRLYKRRGMMLRARRNFEEALKLVPNKVEILEELSALEG